MNISKPFISRPVATTLLTIAVALSGIIAFRLLPVSPLPQVDFPTIAVSAGVPGASPETMASSVATPLERQFGRIAGVTEMTSTSGVGSTNVVLQFDLSRDINAAARDVQAAINAARGNLPSNLPNTPNYRKVNPADAPILILALSSETVDIAGIYDVASSVLQQKLAQVSGVGQVFVGGSSLPAVRVELNPMVANHYGIGLEQIRNVLASANANRPKGELAAGSQAYQLRTTDQLLSAREYMPLIVAYHAGAPVRLSDLGEVRDSVEDLRNAGLANGKPAVLLVVFRQPGANIIETVDRVRDLLPQLRGSVSPAISLDVMMDRTTTIRASIRDVEWTLMISITLVVLVVFLFLRSARATFIPGIVVPVSLVGTFGVMYLAGYSIDNLSIMALTISTGFVVDDAIVVIENITRYLEHGLHPLQAALRGSAEIGFTVLSMSSSLVAVFIPILLMGGIVGRLFREFAVTLSAAIAVSMVVSLTATPMMCARLLKRDTGRHGGLYRASERVFNWIVKVYAAALRVVLRHPVVTMLVLLVTVSVNVYLFVIVPKGFFPQQDTGRMMGMIQAQQSISFQAMREKVTGFVKAVMADPAVESVVAFTGGAGGTNTGRMFVGLNENRAAGVDEVIGRIRRKTSAVPGASLFLQPVQDIRVGGRLGGAQYQFTLQAQDLNTLNEWAPRVLARLRALPELTDVNIDQQNKGLEASLTVDRDTAARLGLTMRDIDNALYDAFGQRPVATMYTELNQYHVVLEVAPQYWQSPETLETIRVHTPRGVDVPLAAFTRFEPSNTPLVVAHQGQFPSVTYSFNLQPGVALGQAVTVVQRAENEIGLPATVQGSFSGTAEAFQSSLANEPILIAAALIAVYVVLGILYESYVHPVTILSTLPSAGVGALLALLLFRTELTVIALIGIILLIGIVKKNAILMIDFALETERRQGKDTKEAIYEAALLRFRPIMMTTMAALLGAVPLAVGTGPGSELRRPLGIAIVGGLIVSQMLTLFTTPVVYLYLEKFRLWMVRPGRRPGPAFAGFVVAFALFLFSACAVGPKYHRPDVPTPPAYKEQIDVAGNVLWKPATPNEQALRGVWWKMFNDPQLDALEDRVAAENQNVATAEARFRQAVALVAFNRANYFPVVTANPAITTSQSSANLLRSRAGITPGTVTTFSFPFGVSWEPDFWGRIRLSVQNAAAAAQASAADLENVKLSMQAELATDYFQAQALDMEEAVLNDTIQAYEKALQLTVDRRNGGVASRADVVQAEAQLDAARAQKTDLGVARTQFEHATAVLTGEPPANVSLPPGQIKNPPPTIPAGIPAQLLERRPDVAGAERLVAAANAQIGLARVAYFPAITFGGTAGFQSGSITTWLSWPSHFFSVGPSVAATLFDFGRRRADVRQAQAAYDATVATYRQTVLTAFQEVEDQLAALRILEREASEQEAAVHAAQESLQLEVVRYKAGTVSYLDVITTQTIALTNQRLALQILERRMTAAVQLIRALGGGWTTTDLPAASTLK